MDVRYINPFIEAMVTVLPTFGITDISRGIIEIKEDMYVNMDITSVLGLIGSARGNISYSFSEDTGLTIASAMMGETVKEMDEMAWSAISELSNQLTGRGCKILSENQLDTDFTTPSVIIGKDVQLLVSPIQTISIDIETSVGRIQVNIGLEV